jgi:hypothetical protein
MFTFNPKLLLIRGVYLSSNDGSLFSYITYTTMGDMLSIMR